MNKEALKVGIVGVGLLLILSIAVVFIINVIKYQIVWL
jgi:hypothetical protein